MAKGKKGVVLVINTKHKANVLGELTEKLAAKKVNVKAVCGYGVTKTKAAIILLVTAPATAKKTLDAAGYNWTEEPVLLIDAPNETGMLAKISSKIGAAGININWIFGSVSGDKSTIVVSTMDIDAARKALAAK